MGIDNVKFVPGASNLADPLTRCPYLINRYYRKRPRKHEDIQPVAKRLRLPSPYAPSTQFPAVSYMEEAPSSAPYSHDSLSSASASSLSDSDDASCTSN